MRVYISGQITGTNDYVERFCKAEIKLINMGYSVINPVAINAKMPKDITYEDIIKHDFFLLDMCDAIYLLNKWQESNGSRREYNYSLAKNKKILFEEAESETDLVIEIKNRR